MKKLLLLAILALMAIVSNAQKPFEGKITYTVEMSGDGSEMMSAFMFSSYEYYFSERNIRLTMGGGMAFMFGTFVVNDATKKSYMIMDEDETAYEMTTIENEEESAEDINPPKIEKLEGSEKILGYTCSKYKMTVVEDSTTMTMYYWVTTELNPCSKKKIGTTNSLYVDGIDGFPLKIVTEFDGIVMTQEATEIVKQKVDPALFEVPAGYRIKDFSESPIGQLVE